MTETYGHWDKPLKPANTDDMFLAWDVPVTDETLEVIGYIDEKEACRHIVKAAGKPSQIHATCDSDVLIADGRDIAHIEISLHDKNGVFNPAAANRITVKVEGAAELIALDNGKPDSHELFKAESMNAYGGLLLAIIRAKREPGDAQVTVTAEGMAAAMIELAVK
jgi:beta-galactosidase